VQKAVALIKKSARGNSVTGVAADLATADGAKTLTESLPDVDILVNNMAIFQAKSFFEIDDQDWMTIFETNVLSGVRLSRFYMPKMLKKNWGRIIFISSESAMQVPTEMIHYGTTKTAQLSVSRGLAQLTAGTGVTVNSVLPGPTRSEGMGQYLEAMAEKHSVDSSAIEKEFFQNIRPSNLLKRFATTEEVAHMVTYLASDLASATNGAALRVDGGTVNLII
jgi:NAD(P)-dependent dehydrogenase (short-subunit alcohol dehydrogenase family)